MKSKRVIKAFDIIVMIFIAVIVLVQTVNMHVPWLETDEYGYLGSAAFFAGLDWSKHISKSNGYFSYVYGFLISPLLRWCPNSLVIFRGIQVLNVIILIINYFIIQKVIIFLKLSESIFLQKFFSVIVTLYCSNIIFGKCALPECFLVLLFNLNTYFLYKLCEKKSWIYCVLLACSNLFLCSMHQRTISIFAATLVTLIFVKISKNQITISKIILFLVIVVAGLVLYKIGKTFIIQKVWLNAMVTEFQSYEAQTRRFSFMLSVNGWYKFFCSMLGKIFYLLVSTNFMLLYFFRRCYKKIVAGYRGGFGIELYVYIFLLTAFVFTIGISCLFVNNPTSTTYLFYGRYNEYIIGIYIAIGLFEFLSSHCLKFDAICIVMFTAVSYICKSFFIHENIDIGNCAILTPAITGYYNKENYFEIEICSLFAILIFILLIVARKICYIKRKAVFLGMVLLCINIVEGFCAFNDFFKEDKRQLHNAVVNITNIVQDMQLEQESQICVVETDNKKLTGQYAKIVQFILKDTDIDFCNPVEITQVYEKYDLVISFDDLWIPTYEMHFIYGEEGVSLYCNQKMEKFLR